jgi:hypothetical protein
MVAAQSAVERRVDDVLDTRVDGCRDGVLGMLDLACLGRLGVVSVAQVEGPDCGQYSNSGAVLQPHSQSALTKTASLPLSASA